MKILFEASAGYRVIEECGPESYIKLPNEKLLFNRGHTHNEYTISWILGFGDKALVLEPESSRQKILERAKNIINIYK